MCGEQLPCHSQNVLKPCCFLHHTQHSMAFKFSYSRSHGWGGRKQILCLYTVGRATNQAFRTLFFPPLRSHVLGLRCPNFSELYDSPNFMSTPHLDFITSFCGFSTPKIPSSSTFPPKIECQKTKTAWPGLSQI